MYLGANLVRDFSSTYTCPVPAPSLRRPISDPRPPPLMDPVKLAKLQAQAAANRLGEQFLASHARGVTITASLRLCPKTFA